MHTHELMKIPSVKIAAATHPSQDVNIGQISSNPQSHGGQVNSPIHAIILIIIFRGASSPSYFKNLLMRDQFGRHAETNPN